MTKNKQRACQPSRWQRLKAELNNLPPDTFIEAYHNTPGAVLLDVRSVDELNFFKPVSEAINISYLLPDLWERLDKLDRNRTYFVFCQTGRRSMRVCTLMKNGAFDPKRIFNLDGGLNGLTALLKDQEHKPPGK